MKQLINILLVEDDLWLAELYIEALQSNGNYRIHHARDAEEALENLDALKKLNLIILDMFLPGHNGLEFLHEIASYQDTKDIPIILLTTISKMEFGIDDERWKAYGVTKYLYKPDIKPYQLVSVVDELLLNTKMVN